LLQLLGVLMGSGDAEAGRAFNDREAARVRDALEGDERMECFVRGRVVAAGSRAKVGLWVLTDQRLLSFEMASYQRSVVALNGTLQLQGQRGRYGATLGLQHGTQRMALYAADDALAFAFAAALAQRVPTLQWRSDLKAALPDAMHEAARAVAESRMRVNPALRHDGAQMVSLLRDLDGLQQRGVLNAAEFSDLKTRLLMSA
jgi:hypothetical protein